MDANNGAEGGVEQDNSSGSEDSAISSDEQDENDGTSQVSKDSDSETGESGSGSASEYDMDIDGDDEDRSDDNGDKPTKPSLPKPEAGTTLFIRNLPFEATEDELRVL